MVGIRYNFSFSNICILRLILILVVFPIVTGGAALIFTAGVVGTSILPTVAAGGLGLLGIGTLDFNDFEFGLRPRAC